MTHDFELLDTWWFDASRGAVWDCLQAGEGWPKWWDNVVGVRLLAEGEPSGVGARRLLTWKTALPYRIEFEMEVTRIVPMELIEGTASGEIKGTGTWRIEPDGSGTRASYAWNVDVLAPWMRLLLPLLRPVFAWNHHKVTGRGEVGLARWLAARPAPRPSAA